MIAEEASLVVADNSGAKRVKCFRVLGQRKRYAHVGDIIKVIYFVFHYLENVYLYMCQFIFHYLAV